MTWRTSALAAALYFAAAAGAIAADALLPARPNIVLILMDDLGYGDVGSYGVTDIRTPNIDSLARTGVRLTDAYANGAVCSPTRAALITGRYQQRAGIEWALTGAPEERDRGLPASDNSLPALLRKSGYVTGLVGKWHLGFKPEFGPNAHGFDEFFGFLAGADDYYAHKEPYGAADLYENTTPVRSDAYLTDEFSRRAVSFIERHASEPFFLEVAYNAPHWPFEPPDVAPSDPRRERPLRPQANGRLNFLEMPDDPTPATRAEYASMVERADTGIGEILRALDGHGIARNTWVIFTSDNGGEWLSRNAPFFHRKATLWEGGIRVPLIMRWPARLPAGKTSQQAVITMDLSASILAAGGVSLPADFHPDGIDVLPSLAGEKPLLERQLYWRLMRSERQQKAVRAGNWKLLVDGGQYLLFELKSDPGERNDLAAQNPGTVRSLKGLLSDWEQDVDRSLAPSARAAFGNPQRVTIAGYDGDAMEPFITRDDRYLFFNNRNDPQINTNLHFAERTGDITFEYRGELAGANSSALDAVASLDRQGEIYFVSTRSYDKTLATVYRGQFDGHTVAALNLLEGVSLHQRGMVMFDVEISADGSHLFAVDGRFAGGPVPKAADIVIAAREGARFSRLPTSADLLKNVNTTALEYAPATSADELELFFTRLDPSSRLAQPVVLCAVRSNANAVFDLPADRGCHLRLRRGAVTLGRRSQSLLPQARGRSLRDLPRDALRGRLLDPRGHCAGRRSGQLARRVRVDRVRIDALEEARLRTHSLDPRRHVAIAPERQARIIRHVRVGKQGHIRDCVAIANDERTLNELAIERSERLERAVAFCFDHLSRPARQLVSQRPVSQRARCRLDVVGLE